MISSQKPTNGEVAERLDQPVSQPAAQLAPMRIGRLEVWPPVQLGSLAGYGDAAMRLVCRQLGCPYAVCEMLLDEQVARPTRRQKRAIRLFAEDHPIAGQLLTSGPEIAAHAAARLVEEGYDAIDLNFACPVRKVLAKGRGGALLQNPDGAIRQMEAVRETVPPDVPVTLKLRLGYDATARSRELLLEILEAACDCGVSAVTIHARTVKQSYDEPSDWQRLAEIAERYRDRLTVIGSGDIRRAEDVLRMIGTAGVHGVSVARGAIGNPWIFSRIRALAEGGGSPPAPTVAEQGRVLLKHFALSERLYGPLRAARMMRKFGIYYSRLHPQAEAVRREFIEMRNANDWKRILIEWYGTNIQAAGH